MGLNMFNLKSRRNHLKGWPPSDMYVLKRTCLYLSHAGWMNHEAEEERARKREKCKKNIQTNFWMTFADFGDGCNILSQNVVIPSKGKLKGDDQNLYK